MEKVSYSDAIADISQGASKLASAVAGGDQWDGDANAHIAATALSCATSVWQQLRAERAMPQVDVAAHRIELPKFVKDAIRDKLGIEPDAPAVQEPQAAKEIASSPSL